MMDTNQTIDSIEVQETRAAFDKLTSYISQNTGFDDPQDFDSQYITLVQKLWATLGDIPLREGSNELDLPFLHFKAGTSRFDVWRWFEEDLNVSTAFLYGTNVHPITGQNVNA